MLPHVKYNIKLDDSNSKARYEMHDLGHDQPALFVNVNTNKGLNNVNFLTI